MTKQMLAYLASILSIHKRYFLRPQTGDEIARLLFVCGRRCIASVASATTASTMQQIHIGNLIRDELRRSGHTNQWLADRIGITPRTLQKLFNKPSIDTQQLLAISRALGIDLFHYYSDTLAAHVQSGHVSTSDILGTE